tara:strand:- start:16838 stop:17695 length:858 start_codon:yes stop_codon:yes gene_type:complete
MRIMRVGDRGSERPAVCSDDGGIRDISSIVSDINGNWLASGGINQLKSLMLESNKNFPTLDSNGLRIGAPLARPGNIIAIGLNYEDHALEAGMEIPEEPIIFCKAPSSYSGPNDDVLIPPGSTKTDWEVELGIVIGKEAKYLKSEIEALEYIAGYCVVNDVSERALQLERGPTWIKGKSAESFCPVGPWLVTPDEINDPGNLSMLLSVNGEVRQKGSTNTMIFGPSYIVWYCSQFMVLEPGDLIATGTPPGVGMGLKPPVYLKAGDIMELEIEGLGKQKQKVIKG